MSPASLGTKAETLAYLASRLTTATILPSVRITVAQWRRDAAAALDAVSGQWWSEQSLIVRSSAYHEDGAEESLAGRFRSILGVSGRSALSDAIEEVIASYGIAAADDQVLIQPMAPDIAWSGVAFTRDPSTQAPYVVINYHESGDTTAVTSGLTGNVRTWMAFDAPEADALAGRFSGVLALLRELQTLLKREALDVEFAVDKHDQLYLFQARPLVIKGPALDPVVQRRALHSIARRIAAANRPHPYLHGQRTVFSVMSDWNPAEMIGIRPRPLALSLYKEIITDGIWAYQRHNYGYRNLRSFPLLINLHGLPYIDVRVSFNSFIPADIDADLAGRLVDHYIAKLLASPALHDKIEFEIVHSCSSFDLDERLERLPADQFSTMDRHTLAASLTRLTNRIIDPNSGLWRGDLERIQALDERRLAILSAELDPVSRIYWLLEDCKRYGSLPFAGLARAGFIAIQILRSLVNIGVLDEADHAAFLTGLDTVSGQMTRDFGDLSKESFLHKYGHLRPGTYDILSTRYDETPDQYFNWTNRVSGSGAGSAAFALSLPRMRNLRDLIRQRGFGCDVVQLFDFLEAAIRGREYAKFTFTRSLSDALVLIASLGEEHGFSRDDMSYLDIRAVYDLFAGSHDIHDHLAASIARGREAYAVTRALALPPVIIAESEAWAFRVPETVPNFITQKRVLAPVARVAETSELEGAIAMISHADPGYDWIFSRGICGFITAFGGSNSHMAIRAAELGLPAVIGAGEELFSLWSSARLLELDGINRHVRILR